MATTDSNEKQVFNFRTLRLIIGALAFAFPCVVVALTGKVTTSISASYYEDQMRDIFVGFMFVIGALLVSYKGHMLHISNSAGSKLWVLARRYEEDLISILGGLAAIATALFPTARPREALAIHTIVHVAGASILFGAIVYFCLVAFLRSVNQKLARANSGFDGLRKTIEEVRSLRQVHSVKEFGYWLLPEISNFLGVAGRVWRDYDEAQSFARAGVSASRGRPTRLGYLLQAYKQKIRRGFVYLICGSLIALVLAIFIVLQVRTAGQDIESTLTFWVETVALGFFGIAWGTASQTQYVRKIHLFLMLRRSRSRRTPAPGKAGGLLGDVQVDT